MKIQDIRRRRLALLIKTQYESQADFVRKTGQNQGEISALLKNKSFGERKARKIETDCGLELGWLDHLDHEPEVDDEDGSSRSIRPISSRERELFDLFASLPRSEQNELFRTLEQKKEHYDKLLEELLIAKRNSAKTSKI